MSKDIATGYTMDREQGVRILLVSQRYSQQCLKDLFESPYYNEHRARWSRGMILA